jgi:hypothetical protein
MNWWTSEGAFLPSHVFNWSSWVGQLEQLPPLALILMIAAGIIFLLYGRSLFRWIVIINAIVLGGTLGWQVGQSTAYPYIVAIGLAVVFGLLGWPLFKFAIAVSSGLVGATLVWQVVSLYERWAYYWPAFVVVGFLVFAILGWFLLKAMIIVVTSVQGAAMIILSLVVLAQRGGILVGSIWTQVDEPGAVHLAVLILAVLGVLYQIGFAEGGAKKAEGDSA